jgi:DnaJ-class molecular chaperone
MEVCDHCNGDGTIWGGVNRLTCWKCEGTKWLCPQHGAAWVR